MMHVNHIEDRSHHQKYTQIQQDDINNKRDAAKIAKLFFGYR
jgi:hypothetical protein